MRVMVVICILFGFLRTARAAPEKCTVEWAVELARSSSAKSRRDAEEAILPIGQCPNSSELYGAIGKQKPRPPNTEPAPAAPSPTPAAPRSGTGASAGRNAGKREPGVAAPGTPSKKPSAGAAKPTPKPSTPKTEGAPLGPAAGSTVVAEASGVDPFIYAVALASLKKGLLERIQKLQKECRGFADCDPKDLRDWLASFNEYLVLVQSKDAPVDVLREAGELISRVADQSPEFRMAEIIARALERMDVDAKAKFRKKFPNLEKALDADPTTRLKALLEQPEKLGAAYAQVAAIGASQFAVGGRAVVAELDLKELSIPNCAADLPRKLTAALEGQLPIGMKIYGTSDAPDVVLKATLVAGQSGTACPGAAGTQCVQLDVTMVFDSKNPVTLSFQSVPFPACPTSGQINFDALAIEAFSSFAVALRAADATVEQARLIRAGCVDLLSKGAEEFSAALVADQTAGRHVVYLPREDSNSWRGFRQELLEGLIPHQKVLGTVSPEAPRAGFPGVSLSWKPDGEIRDGVPDAVYVTLRWNGAGGPPEAALKLAPKRGRKDCTFSDVSFKQAAAAQVTFWLLGLSLAERRQGEEIKKNWAIAPLALLLAGLPQFVDDDPRNNTRGAILAGVDLAFLATGAGLVLSSIEVRNGFAKSGRSTDLERANSRLYAGLWVGGLALVPRAISFAW